MIIHDHSEFKKAAAFVRVDPEGRSHDAQSYGAIASFRIKNNTTATFRSSDYMQHDGFSVKEACTTYKKLDDAKAILSTLLVKDLNHPPKSGARIDASAKCCTL